MKSTRRPHSINSRGAPLRSYSSFNPLKACLPPRTSTKASDLNVNGLTKKKRSKNLPSTLLSKSIKFKAQDFISHKDVSLHKDYVVNELIGEGGFGEVYACKHRATGAERAVKILPKSSFTQENDEVRNEFNITKDLDHPSIIKLFHLYEDKNSFHIVSDIYAGGDFLDMLTDVDHLSEQEAAIMMNQILSCVHYCHSRGIAHRDLKPENILMGREGGVEDLKVIDFGLAVHCGEFGRMKGVVGTPYYISPQVLEGDYTAKTDVFSCGTICFLALCGYAPFDGDSMEDIMQAVHRGEFDFDDPVWDTVSEEAKDFVCWLLSYEEEDRPTAEEALQHPWLVSERQASNQSFFKSSRQRSSMTSALESMQKFDCTSKLKQATYALLSSQLLPKEEREEIDKLFRILDADGSGLLNKDEFQEGFSLTDAETEEIFERVNFSASGSISYSEFVCACIMQTDFLDEQKLQAAFAEFDLDGSGSISVEELKQVFAGCSKDGAVDQETIDGIIAQVDINQDGEIDFEEFRTMMAITASQPSKETLKEWTLTKAKSVSHGGFSLQATGTGTGTGTGSLDQAPKEERKFQSLNFKLSSISDESKSPGSGKSLPKDDFSCSFGTATSSTCTTEQSFEGGFGGDESSNNDGQSLSVQERRSIFEALIAKKRY